MADFGQKKKIFWMVFFATICALEVVLEIGIIDAILEGNSEHGLETQTVQKT